MEKRLSPAQQLIDAFEHGLNTLWPEGDRLGLAVSGGPDSLALLLLANGARPGKIEAATVNHGLRPQAAEEAALVARLCRELGVPHTILTVKLDPGNLQAEARRARYGALFQWVDERKLDALATAHHADDQLETLIMRLNRGSGISGLAGVRARGNFPDNGGMVIRPLLGWRKTTLSQIVELAGIVAANDTSNHDPRFDRSRLRRSLAMADWLHVESWAESAKNLADADASLEWAAMREWADCVDKREDGTITYQPRAPHALRLRVILRILAEMSGSSPRGSAVARLIDSLEKGHSATLGGILAKPQRGLWLFKAESRARRRSEETPGK